MTNKIPERPGRSLAFPDQVRHRLGEIGSERLDSMDKVGIDFQVLSVIGPGAELLYPSAASGFTSEYNNLLAERIQPWPERFKAFAHLPITNPEAAAFPSRLSRRQWKPLVQTGFSIRSIVLSVKTRKDKSC